MMGQFILENSGTIDSRVIVNLPLTSIYETNELNMITINNLLKTYLYQRQAVFSDQVFGETYYYHDSNLVNKVLKLVENIGVTLFGKLNDKQKMLMARTAGSFEFTNKIDINSVYNYIESHES